MIAPVSIDYLDRHGSRTVDPAFVGDDELGSIWRVMCAAPVVADVAWLPIVPAIQDGGHRASHRARAAGGAHGRISGALSPRAMGDLAVSPSDPRPAGPTHPGNPSADSPFDPGPS